MRPLSVWWAASALAIFAVSSTGAWADVPSLIHYQGKLMKPTGELMAGPVNLTIRLYDGPGGGASLLHTETHSGVTLNKGLFSIHLGSTGAGPVPDSALVASELYLGVEVDAPPELAPRTRIVTAPYTTKARAAEQLVKPNTLNTAVAIDAGGALEVDGNSGAIGQILTSQGTGSPPIWKTSGGGGFSPAAPDGYDGMTVITRLNLSTTPYTVPAGKNLFITFVRGDNQWLRINGTLLYYGGDVSPTLPFMAAGGQVVNSTGNDHTIHGFLVDAGVTPVSLTNLTSTPYTVPAGKALFVTYVRGDNQWLRINGTLITYGSYQLLNSPILLASGDVLSSTGNDLAINGFLRNN